MDLRCASFSCASARFSWSTTYGQFTFFPDWLMLSESSVSPMVTILRPFLHMLQVAGMVGVGFALLSLLEAEYTKKLANLISGSILARPRRKTAERSRL
jgi:hypothetical protein